MLIRYSGGSSRRILYLWLFTIKLIYLFCFVACQNSSDTQLLDYRYACLDQSSVPPSSTYQTNLNNLISSLSSDSATSNGFGNRTSGSDQSNMVYGLYLCRGDVNTSLCHSCVQNSSRLLRQHCPNNASAILWYPFCLLRYSNQNFFGKLTTRPRIPMFDARQNFTSAGEFDSDARVLMNGLIQMGSESTLMFGTHMFNINGTQRRYGWVQCSRDITSEECRTCLSNMLEDVENCCEEKKVWRVFSPSCIVMYETQPFFLNGTLPDAPAPQQVMDFFASPILTYVENKAKEGGNTRSWIIIIAVVIGTVVVALLAVSTYYFWCLKRKKDKHAKQEDGLNPMFSQDQIDKGESVNADLPMMPLSTILTSTGSFSDEYKLGRGGFGTVFKGVLPDGKQIAVKRLSKTSVQGVDEFKNEVILIAKLQHRNLVRLLACCIEQNEKLLIYEYMPNSSLDFHLFDKVKGAELNWKQRSNIINGIAKGLLYLHEDSRLRVIHRDLKASNILLDHQMNPKISDFGLARTFGGDQWQANTIKVVGTYGYMAPEYAMEGLFSVKSDVFSFGVILLEIISGKKNARFYLSEHGQSLPIYAWNLWCESKGLELMDPLIEKSCVLSEVLKCIHIGLLCVQEDAADRPTMSSVVHMLASDTVTLPRPTRPAFSVGRAVIEQGSSSNTSISVNEVTLSEVRPRMSRLVTMIMHHGGKLMRNEENELDYIGSEVDVWEDLDSDLIHRFLIIDLCKLHNYHRIDHCYWLALEKSLEDGLRELRWDCDTDVLDMCIASMRNDGEIEVFIEHPVVENQTFSKSRGHVGEKEGAENVKESDEEGFVNQQNEGVEETKEKEDSLYRPPPIISEDDKEEEVVVDRGSGSNIRRKRAQNFDDIISGDETDSGSEDISDQMHDEDAQPVENFEGVAGPLQIDDAEVEEDASKH
ncbi:S-locus receptor kinase, C-terminal [Sesbania bispinosa]|nr:S-locus receptor kinase, C-terminal [Sesbania bispinosa]